MSAAENCWAAREEGEQGMGRKVCDVVRDWRINFKVLAAYGLTDQQVLVI